MRQTMRQTMKTNTRERNELSEKVWTRFGSGWFEKASGCAVKDIS